MQNERRARDRDADVKEDGLWSLSGVYVLAAALGLLCCGLPVLLAAGVGGMFGFINSGTAIGALAVAALVAAIALLIRRNRQRGVKLRKENGSTMTNINDNNEVSDWAAIDDCCGPADDCCVPTSKDEQKQSSQTPERQPTAGEPVDAGRLKELPRPLQPAD